MKVNLKSVIVTKPFEIDILGMSYSDATILRRILARIGGEPSGNRGAIDRLTAALNEAGIGFDCGIPATGVITLH